VSVRPAGRRRWPESEAMRPALAASMKRPRRARVACRLKSGLGACGRPSLARDGGGFGGGEVECKGAIMPGVGLRARNRERGPGAVLAPPSFFHPRQC